MFSEANSRKVEKRCAISALLLLLSAYGKGANGLGPTAPAATAQSDAAACVQPLDFAALVSNYGAAVVNISTTQTLRGEGFGPGFPGLLKDDPFFEFFRPLPWLIVGLRTIRGLELAGNPGVELAAADPIFFAFHGGQQPERRC